MLRKKQRMVVNITPNGWRIFFHRAHALLAAHLALEWKHTESIQRLAETIAAIAQHDDLEREFEGNHLTEAGAPMDFTQRPREPDMEVPRWQELVTNALYRSRWVALLSGMHVCFLTEEKRVSDPELDHFLNDLESRMAEWRHQLGITKAEVGTAYAFMQWCDRLSLILVQDKLPEKERWLEISKGPDGQRYDLCQRAADQTIDVRPWPFSAREFTVTADARLLPQLQYPDNDTLIRAMQEATVEMKTWTFRRS
jgi:hypothetical protein